MAGDDTKLKKKKGKKAEELAPEPEPEPEAAPAPEPAVSAGDDMWPPADDEAPPDWGAAEDQAPDPEVTEGEAPAEDADQEKQEIPIEGEEMELPPAPKKKPVFFVHWDRRKPKFYDYNFDYGSNYYSSMVKYMDQKSGHQSSIAEVPRRMAWAERGIRSNVERKATRDVRTETLLANIRSSIKNFETSQRSYMWENSKYI